ncbi:AAA family ATPase [Robertkochia aurantiaca]|uniref:AAA family ATPase n=1 Tax=Robertkochia aurantiaca TaxID=2873700 RepID=UPI001CCA3D51|nr:ATP-binding protein [Robertkochia sp. 3YJGBD-33]
MEEKLEQKPSDLIKIVLYGPESTGKTTLARELSEHFNTRWVPEYAREYLQDKWEREGKVCELDDLLPIAEGQIALENAMSVSANEILICDTDILETKVYSEAYFNEYCDPRLEKYALENQYDLYLLTYIDTPWVADDLRDKPNEREAMYDRFRSALESYDRPYIVLKGDREERKQIAINAINQLKAKKI